MPETDLPEAEKMLLGKAKKSIADLDTLRDGKPEHEIHIQASVLALELGELNMRQYHALGIKMDTGFGAISQLIEEKHGSNGNGCSKTVIRPTKKQMQIAGGIVSGPPILLGALWLVWQIVKFHMEKGA
jgi:hypothetical protein